MAEKTLWGYRERLLRQGLPYGLVQRNVRELRDHLQDLEQQARDAGMDRAASARWARDRLGDLDRLADGMLQKRRSGLLHRHPLLLGTVLPPLLCLFSFAVLILVFIAAVEGGKPFQTEAGELPLWIRQLYLALQTVLYIGVPALALMLLALYHRARMAARYWMPGIFLMLALACGASLHASGPEPEQQQRGSIGMSIGYGMLGFRGPLQAEHWNSLRLMFCTALGALLVEYRRRRESALERELSK